MAETDSINISGQTIRYGLPLLYPGQAHKEVTHNQAITRLDLLVSAVVQGVADSPDAVAPVPGQCWLVSGTAQGVWAQKRGYIAAFLEGEWLYLAPQEGQIIYALQTAGRLVFSDGVWRDTPGFAPPAAGSVIDAEARAAILVLSETLQRFGLLRQT